MDRIMARLTGRIIAKDMEKCGLGIYRKGFLLYDRKKWASKEECMRYVMWVYRTSEAFAGYIIE